MKIPLSYNTNGLRTLPLVKAIKEIARHKYEGVELSFDIRHFNPNAITKGQLNDIKLSLYDNSIKPICIATGCDNLLSNIPFEPSLISNTISERQRRIDLIRKSIEIASFLSVPVVNFSSGIRHNEISKEDARNRLIDGISSCLCESEKIILAIEPEPGFFIETTTEAISIINELNHPRLMLNIDIGHVYCCEHNFTESIKRSLRHVRHTHIEDIKNKIHHHEIPGTGDINFAEVLKIYNNESYPYFWSIELYHHTDVWEQAIKESRDYLLTQMKEVSS